MYNFLLELIQFETVKFTFHCPNPTSKFQQSLLSGICLTKMVKSVIAILISKIWITPKDHALLVATYVVITGIEISIVIKCCGDTTSPFPGCYASSWGTSLPATNPSRRPPSCVIRMLSLKMKLDCLAYKTFLLT